jgi:hypothetical protein
MTKFQEKYSKGILSKKDYQQSEIVQKFIEWLNDFMTENSKRKLTDFSLIRKSFEDAIINYKWGKGNLKDGSFNNVYERFNHWRNEILIDDLKARNIGLEILKWGGVESHNKTKINQRKEFLGFLKSIKKQIEQDEIIIEDLNPNHINSGYTKIYAAISDRFIIYDGRVGAALCYLVRKFLEEYQISNIPSELVFGWGEGRGGKKSRNPGNDEYKFANITQNRNLHFESNIKASWLLENIAITEQNKEIPKGIFELQTALFVLGEELPKNEHTSDVHYMNN